MFVFKNDFKSFLVVTPYLIIFSGISKSDKFFISSVKIKVDVVIP
jgi:hypothetical protein